MHRVFLVSLATSLALLLCSTAALHADVVPPVEGPEEGSTGHGVTLPRGMLEVTMPLSVNLSDGAEAEPITLSPDIWLGARDDLSVGVVSSFYGSVGFLGFDGAIGTGFCFTGKEDGCIGGFYNNIGVELLYRIPDTLLQWLPDSVGWQFALNGGVQVGSLDDPFAVALKGGIKGMWRSGPFDVIVHPSIFIGLTERDLGNDESIALPITARHAFGEAIYGLVQTGLAGDLQGFEQTYVIPLSFAGHYVWNDFTVGGVLSIPFLGASDGFGGWGVDSRTVSVTVSYRGMVL